jgi:hypothetical protein
MYTSKTGDLKSSHFLDWSMTAGPFWGQVKDSEHYEDRSMTACAIWRQDMIGQWQLAQFEDKTWAAWTLTKDNDSRNISRKGLWHLDWRSANDSLNILRIGQWQLAQFEDNTLAAWTHWRRTMTAVVILRLGTGIGHPENSAKANDSLNISRKGLWPLEHWGYANDSLSSMTADTFSRKGLLHPWKLRIVQWQPNILRKYAIYAK